MSGSGRTIPLGGPQDSGPQPEGSVDSDIELPALRNGGNDGVFLKANATHSKTDPCREKDPSDTSRPFFPVPGVSEVTTCHLDAPSERASNGPLVSSTTTNAKMERTEGGHELPSSTGLRKGGSTVFFSRNASGPGSVDALEDTDSILALQVPLSSSSRIDRDFSAAAGGSDERASAFDVFGAVSATSLPQSRSPSVLTPAPSMDTNASADYTDSAQRQRLNEADDEVQPAAEAAEEQQSKQILSLFRRFRNECSSRSMESDEESWTPRDGCATGALTGKEAAIGSILRLLRWTAPPAQLWREAAQAPVGSINQDTCGERARHANSSRDRSIFLADPVRVTSAAVDRMLERVAADERMTAKLEEKKRLAEQKERAKAASLFGDAAKVETAEPSEGRLLPVEVKLPARRIPRALPSKLDMPLSERCSFCQKHDSMCANDHRRWTALMANYREKISSTAYARLPAFKRRALFFLTAAYGAGSFATMQLLAEKKRSSLLTARFVCPLAILGFGDVVAQERLRSAGTVHLLHVAAAFQNTAVLRALLESPYTYLLPSSERMVDPLDWLDDKTLRSFAELPATRAHLLDSGIVWALRCGDAALTRELMATLAAAFPNDPRTGWWHACQRLLCGQYEDCVLECEALLRAAVGEAWVTPSAIQGLASLATAALAQKSGENDILPEKSERIPQELAAQASPPPLFAPGSFPLRRLPFRIISEHLLPFCDPPSLWCLYNATRVPLLRWECEMATRPLSPNTVTGVLMRMPGFVELLSEIAKFQPSEDECAALHLSTNHPVKPLGVLVTGINGFRVMVVRVSATGRHSVPEDASGTPLRPKRTVAELLYDALVSSDDESGDDLARCSRERNHAKASQIPPDAAEVVVSRQFRIDRNATEEPWLARPVDKWAPDVAATKKLAAFLKTRSGAAR